MPSATVTMTTAILPFANTAFLAGATMTSSPQPTTVTITTTSTRVPTDCAYIAQVLEQMMQPNGKQGFRINLFWTLDHCLGLVMIKLIGS
jgi:hypothetical protein